MRSLWSSRGGAGATQTETRVARSLSRCDAPPDAEECGVGVHGEHVRRGQMVPHLLSRASIWLWLAGESPRNLVSRNETRQDSHVTESAPGDEGERTVGDRAVEHIDILLLLTLSKGMGAANREAVQEVHFC